MEQYGLLYSETRAEARQFMEYAMHTDFRPGSPHSDEWNCLSTIEHGGQDLYNRGESGRAILEAITNIDHIERYVTVHGITYVFDLNKVSIANLTDTIIELKEHCCRLKCPLALVGLTGYNSSAWPGSQPDIGAMLRTVRVPGENFPVRVMLVDQLLYRHRKTNQTCNNVLRWMFANHYNLRSKQR